MASIPDGILDLCHKLDSDGSGRLPIQTVKDWLMQCELSEPALDAVFENAGAIEDNSLNYRSLISYLWPAASLPPHAPDVLNSSHAGCLEEAAAKAKMAADEEDGSVKRSVEMRYGSKEGKTVIKELQSCGKESAEKSTTESEETWLCFTTPVDSVEEIDDREDDGEYIVKTEISVIHAHLLFCGGVKKGSRVQLVIKKHVDVSVTVAQDKHAHLHSTWQGGDFHKQESALCAEGVVVSVITDSYIKISVEKGLCMETTSKSDHVGYGIGPESEQAEVFPWKVVNKEAQWNVLTKIVEDIRITPGGLCPSTFALHLGRWHAQSPWTFSNSVPSGAAIELLFHKWESLQQFISETHVFYFLSAERLRSHTGPLPKFQELEREGGWLRKKTISIHDVMTQTYAKSVLTVSHTWCAKGNAFDPADADNKMQALSTYLADNMEIEEVWLDYGCVPQGERTPEEQSLFESTLPVINLLYLGTKVLRIVGKEYFQRFWPQFESYLSRQSLHKYGFKSEQSDRCCTVFIEGQADDLTTASRIAFFDTCTYEAAVAKLSKNDVKVTNETDKTTCLTKLRQLKEFMAVIFNTLG